MKKKICPYAKMFYGKYAFDYLTRLLNLPNQSSKFGTLMNCFNLMCIRSCRDYDSMGKGKDDNLWSDILIQIRSDKT